MWLARVAAGLVGIALIAAGIVGAYLPLLIFIVGGVNNECVFDGGSTDCYPAGERALILGWGFAGLGACAALIYAGGAGIYWALTRRMAPRVGMVAAVGLVLAALVLLPWVGSL
jgi:hypothetical protein